MTWKHEMTGFLPNRKRAAFYAGLVSQYGDRGLDAADRAIQANLVGRSALLKKFSGLEIIPDNFMDKVRFSRRLFEMSVDGYCWKDLPGYEQWASTEKFVTLSRLPWHDREEKLFSISAVIPQVTGNLIRGMKILVHFESDVAKRPIEASLYSYNELLELVGGNEKLLFVGGKSPHEHLCFLIDVVGRLLSTRN